MQRIYYHEGKDEFLFCSEAKPLLKVKPELRELDMQALGEFISDKNNYRYVFVCGLQRSGTSVLGRNVARLENCTRFKDTGVLEDEGQYLQDVYPSDREYGGTGRYGFDRRAHLTEASDLLTPENIGKLQQSWHSHWDPRKTICVEKTPANLLMTRFLQAAFPNSYFVVIKRHPVAVSLATQRWKVSITSLHSLFEHWLLCHEVFEQDKKYLKHVYELKYEEYIENSARCHEEIAAFLGTRLPTPAREDSFRYVTRWDGQRVHGGCNGPVLAIARELSHCGRY